MNGYRVARRSFLTGIGGAVGLELLLRGMEASAQGEGPPPRFLMMHWPVGTIRTQFIPDGSGTTYVTSGQEQGPGHIIAPFDTPELREHTIILHGFNMDGIRGEGGGHEDGTPYATTGASSPGTRDNGGEPDDGCAGGPSWDQILLKHGARLARRNDAGTLIGRGYYNTICDRRVDSYETSTRCLSYGYETRQINSARPGGTIHEHRPLLPQLSPLLAYKDLFSGFAPGGSLTDGEALRLLKLRKSVLDYSLREMNRLQTLGPSSERAKIEGHAEAVRKLEAQLSAQINEGGAFNECALPPIPEETLLGRDGDSLRVDYDVLTVNTSDEVTHEAVGKAHAAIIRTAFACDLLRVATFQWSPGTNHVSFKGVDPNDPESIYMHHPLSHKVADPGFYNASRPQNNAYVWDAMVNVNRWYFKKVADIINEFRRQVDPLDPKGGSLLDSTVIPMVTEVAEGSHTREGHGAVIFGGARLGMQGGQFQNVSGIHNQLWVTVAQAFLGANTVDKLANEVYVKNGATPIAGLWKSPV